MTDIMNGYDIEGCAVTVEWGDPDVAGWRRLKVLGEVEIATLQRGHTCYSCGLPAAVTCDHPALATRHSCIRHALGVPLPRGRIPIRTESQVYGDDDGLAGTESDVEFEDV